MDLVQELKRKKITLTDLQTKKSRFEGQYDQLLKDLQTKFGVTSLEEAKDMLIKLDAESAAVSSEAELLISKLDAILNAN